MDPSFPGDLTAAIESTAVGRAYLASQISLTTDDGLSGLAACYELAREAHARANQFRRSGAPYVVHPLRVAVLVALHFPQEAMRMFFEDSLRAALLHDTLEDTAVTSADVLRVTGPSTTVLTLVTKLTNDEAAKTALGKTEYMSRKLEGLLSEFADPLAAIALLIKLCDRLDNVSDVHGMSMEFTRRYGAETREMMRRVLLHENAHLLWPEHRKLIADISERVKE
eukprot:ANDGO_00890.mRNA.1 Guanosine-3'